MSEDSFTGAPLEQNPQKPAMPAWIGVARIAVIGMGIIFVAGFALVAVTIVNRLSHDKADARASLSGGRFGVSDIHVAPDDEVLSASLDGGRLAIRVKGKTGEEVIIVDVTSGTELGRIRLRPLTDLAHNP